VAHGGIKKAGLPPEKAAEYVSGQSPKSLPESAPKKTSLKQRMCRHSKN